ncbi:cerato-ulmin [Verticillium dahliae]
MKSFTAIVALFAGLAMATPATLDTRGSVCSGLYGNPQCCATDVLGVASLDCQNRKSPHPLPGISSLPSYTGLLRQRYQQRLTVTAIKTAKSANNANDFKQSCASTGKSAFCCTLPVAGQAVLCNKPVGV